MSIIKTAYKDLISDHKKDVHFWMFITFLPTFIFLRLLVYSFVFKPPYFFISINGEHIHHFTWGIATLAITGYLGLKAESMRTKIWIAAFYGIGLALAFDEFGMWLHLEDDYWTRHSYDAILIISAWLLNTVYFYNFWSHLFRHIFRIKPKQN